MTNPIVAVFILPVITPAEIGILFVVWILAGIAAMVLFAVVFFGTDEPSERETRLSDDQRARVREALEQSRRRQLHGAAVGRRS